jgi:hypothetical protein
MSEYDRHAAIFSPVKPNYTIASELTADALELRTYMARTPIQTQVGCDVAFARLVDGATPKVAHARQLLIEALAARPEARKKLQAVIATYAAKEQGIADFLGGDVGPGGLYKGTRRYRRLLQDTVIGIVDTLNEIDLQFAVDPGGVNIRDVTKKSEDFDVLFTKKIWKKMVAIPDEDGTIPKKPRYERRVAVKRPDSSNKSPYRFRNMSNNKVLTAAGLFGVVAVKSLGVLNGAMITGYPLFWYSFFRSTSDYDEYVNPYTRTLAESRGMHVLVEALGEADMVCAFAEMLSRPELRMSFAHEAEGDRHFFMAQGLVNPILALSQQDVVRNDIALSGPTFITGPNSGGKSCLQKAFGTDQLSFQAGLPICADFAIMSRVDRIHMIPAESPVVDDGDGRLGFDFSRLRPAFYEATPHTMILVDDCVQGTTFAESMRLLNAIAQGYSKIGADFVFATHVHELVTQFERARDGRFLKMGHIDGKVNWKVEKGISTTSFAENVAAKHDMDPVSISKELERRGLDGNMRDIVVPELSLSSLTPALPTPSSNGNAANANSVS